MTTLLAVFDHDTRAWRHATADEQANHVPLTEAKDRAERLRRAETYLARRGTKKARSQARQRRLAKEAEYLAFVQRQHARWDRTPEQVAADEALCRAELDADHARWMASGEPDLLAELQAKRAAQRAVALAEHTALEAGLRSVRRCAIHDSAVEAAEAEHARATADWHVRHDHLFSQVVLDRARKRLSEGPKKMTAITSLLPPGTPLPATVPMMGGRGEAQSRLWAPILACVPCVERTDAHPTMPDTGHPLRDAINAAIPGMMRNPCAYVDGLAVIEAVHPVTAALVGTVTPAVKARSEALRQDGEHALVPPDFIRDHKGEPQRDNIDNVRFLLTSLRIQIRFNKWLERVELRGWEWHGWTTLDDVAVARLRMRAGQTGTRFLPSKEFAWDALLSLAHDNPVDPACDLLDRLEDEWDGTPRLASWLTAACGVPDDDYHRAVGTVTLLGLVARIRHPGIKFDLMPVLVSETQGTSKSTLAKLLAMNDDWFVENVALGESAKELVLLMAGKSVAEISEMRTRGEVDAVKAMISTTHDEGRPAYGRATVKRARRHIFIGTTNRREFLEDPTGGRRFLPIMVRGEISLAWVRENLDQLMGEACALEARGADISLPRGVWALAAEYQEAATAKSSAELLLADWFGGEQPAYVSAANLTLLVRQALGRDVKASTYAQAMRNLGFVSKTRRMGNAAPARCWVRGEPERNASGFGARLGIDGRPTLHWADGMTPPAPQIDPRPLDRDA
jgi:hypothetical protein